MVQTACLRNHPPSYNRDVNKVYRYICTGILIFSILLTQQARYIAIIHMMD